MNDTDVIERLRSTYAAVAAQTPAEVPRPGPATRVRVVADESIRPTPRGTRRRLVTLAAVVFATVGIVATVTTVGGDRRTPATESVEALIPRLRHATLDRVPAGMGLVSVSTTEDRDVLTFDGGSRRFELVTERATGAGVGPGEIAEIRGGTGAAYQGDDSVIVRWMERPGVVVMLDGIGFTVAELLAIADSVMMVSDQTWQQATERAGFATVTDADRAEFAGELPGTGPTEPVLDRNVHGSLQTGMWLLIGCCDGVRGPTMNTVGFDGAGVYLVTATPDVVTVDVVLRGEVVATMTTQSDPGQPTVRVSSFRLDDESARGVAVARFFDASGVLLDEQVVR